MKPLMKKDTKEKGKNEEGIIACVNVPNMENEKKSEIRRQIKQEEKQNVKRQRKCESHILKR